MGTPLKSMVWTTFQVIAPSMGNAWGKPRAGTDSHLPPSFCLPKLAPGEIDRNRPVQRARDLRCPVAPVLACPAEQLERPRDRG